jgi:FAD-linked sulfhydryl oxidase
MPSSPDTDKPDNKGQPCRSCTSKTAFKAWTSQAKDAVPKVLTATSPQTTTSAAAMLSQPSLDTDCPADVETLGRSTWTLLHTIAATYPDSPTASQQSDLLGFVHLFSRIYPCWVCAGDFQVYISRVTPRVKNRTDFGKWLCDAHNDVNRKLGKAEFNCSNWEQRWRTGPNDGRCN